MKKGETFQKEKKGKERSGNISEGEMERKGVETFQKEKWKGKERKGNILQRRRKERKIRKEEKACGGSHSDAVGYGELSFRYSRGPAYWGIVAGIPCGVQASGWGLRLVSMNFPIRYV